MSAAYFTEKPINVASNEEMVEEMKLSQHFLLREFTRSAVAESRGIDNAPNAAQLDNLRLLAGTLEEVRALLGNQPIIISSGFRSGALNRAVGGSATSSHGHGLAVDFVCPQHGHVMRICEAIRDSGIQFDQLIYEQGNTEWVHLGIDPRLRRQVMSWSKSAGYVTGIQKLWR